MILMLSWSPERIHANICPDSVPSDSKVRKINICVLNDVDKPVNQGLISEILFAVSAEFSSNAEIVFEFDGVRPFSGDISAWPIDLGIKIKKACPADTELRVLLTNKRLLGSELPPSGEDSAQDSELAGSSHLYFGYAIIFNVEERYRVRDAVGNPAPITALKHELGHLFELEHTPDKQSFMFTPSSRSSGQWTSEVLSQIEKSRGRTWFSGASPKSDPGPEFMCR